MLEIDFKHEVRRRFRGWCESYEPGRGGGLGIPDLQALIDGQLWPIELKVGRVLKRGGVQFALRPVQLQWHNRFFLAGGHSFIMVQFEARGVKDLESLIGVVSNRWVNEKMSERLTNKFKLQDHLIIRPEHDIKDRLREAIDLRSF